MKNIKTRLQYVRMLLPAVLVAVLVLNAVCLYKAPDFDGGLAATANAAAPKLETTKQKKEEKKEPVGTAVPLGAVAENAEYEDGVYTGRAQGYGGMITVRVTIKNGKIASVQIVSAPGEDQPYFGKAKVLLKTIVKSNSTNVDTVSGATYSSNGIILAVRNALAKAGKGKSKKQKSPKKKTPKIPTAINSGDWADGTYEGTGEGFGGKMTVAVTIKDGKITSVTVKNHKDDTPYIDNAKNGVIPAVIKKQGTGVDTVSGATFSSVGIIAAINDALGKAAKEAKKGTGNSIDAEQKQDDEASTGRKITKTVRVYADGGKQFEDYDLLATYVIDDGKIVDIIDVKQRYREPTNNSYVNAAYRGLLGQISKEPTLEQLDTVSGATCTFDALANGGRQALQEAN